MAMKHGQQKRTYLPYTRGVPPRRMRIGSLFLDPNNPIGGLETKRFMYKEGIPESEFLTHIEDWTGEPDCDDPCTLRFQASKEWKARAAISGVFHADAEKEGSNYATIEGKSGRRFEIEKPMAFWDQEVANQPGVQAWIRKQLSISRKTLIANKLKRKHASWRPPHIYLLTGVQLISDGIAQVGSSNRAGQGFEGKLDPGMAHGVPTGQNISAGGSYSRSNEASTEFGPKGERIWAAQFMQLDVEFEDLPGDHGLLGWKSIGPKPEKPMRIWLRELEDLGENAVRDTENTKQVEQSRDGTQNEPAAKVVGLRAIAPDTDDDSDEVPGQNFHVSDIPYAQSMSEIDWDMYEEYSRYWESFGESDKQ